MVVRLPSALDPEVLDRLLGAADPALFLDYDGVLSEIVDDPSAAVITPELRAAVAAVVRRYPVAVVSGRDLSYIRAHVDLDGLVYAGSHGFDLDGAGRLGAEAFLPALDRAERQLTERLRGVPGALIERTRFTISVHYRMVADSDLPTVAAAVAAVTGLRRTGGKRVFELRPSLDWGKGRAVRHLIASLGLHDHVALYLGDDDTDEDAFTALAQAGEGFGILVGERAAPTAAAAQLRDPSEVRVFLERLASR